jgi:HPt (histidine-containing phosphotransfer) domain-containing protein
METADPTAAGALAHRLKGSAQGIGAWRVAAAAESVEHAAAMRPGEFTGAVATLAGRIEEARSVEQELLRSH